MVSEQLKLIPRPVLDGLFLYLAVTALHTNQLFERITLLVTEQVSPHSTRSLTSPGALDQILTKRENVMKLIFVQKTAPLFVIGPRLQCEQYPRSHDS